MENGITKDSVELKILMEVLRTYDKLLHEIEKEAELKLIALDELKKKLESSHINSSGEKLERANQFKTIINNAIEQMLICRQIESNARYVANREIENCNTNAIFRELFISSVHKLNFQELESSALNQLFEEMQQKTKTLPGFNMDLPAQEITHEYLANCYAKLGINREFIINKLEPEIQELKKSAENIWATRMKLIRPEESAQLPFGTMDSNENKLRDNLANRLKELEDKYKALGIFANQKLTKLFYDTKLKTEALLSKNWIKQYVVDYYGRDTKELEIYRQIMLEKIQQICNKEPVSDNLIHFGKENFNTLINFIREYFSDKRDIDIKQVLEDTYIFEMILAVESEYSIRQRRQRGAAIIQSGVEATKVNTRMQVIDNSTVKIRLPNQELHKETENNQEL